MDWLIPSVMSTLAAAAILAFCYFYLYAKDGKKYLRVWAISWSIYFLRYIFMLAMVLGQKSPLLLIGNQLATLISGVLLLYGSFLFVQKKFPKLLIYLSGAGTAWIVISVVGNFSFMVMSLPTFTLLAIIYVWTGILFIRKSGGQKNESRVVGTAFVLWGIHKADYPFLRPVLWFAPWGYLLGAVLELIVALGILMMYFQKTKEELIQKEASLAESERKFKNFFHTNPSATVVWKSAADDFILVEVNEAADKITRDFASEFISCKAGETYKEHPFLQEKLKQCFFEKSVIEFEYKFKSSHKTDFDWVNIRLVFQEPDTILMYMDLITERKLAENEIKRQKRLFETIFDTIPDGVVITDTSREIRLANKGMESTFGYRPEELIGLKTKVLYANDQYFKDTGKKVFGRQAQTAKDLYITRYQDKNKREFSGETFGARLYDENNEWIGNLGIMRDITQREEAELRVRKAQQMESIGTLAGGIAHDFNNLLFPIIGFSELLLSDLSPQCDEYNTLNEILTAAKRGRDLVRQILSIGRQPEQNPIALHMQTILKEVLQLMRSTIPTSVNITQDIQQDCGAVKADPTQLHQVAINLITNASHALEDDEGKIAVELKEVVLEKEDFISENLESGRYALLRVSDTGPGISKEIIGKIFDPYFTTKEQGKGTGLGLSVAYGIIKSYGGDIKVYSEPGKGTSFHVYLPVINKTEETEKTENKRPLPTGNERILVVDDEAPIIRLEEALLKKLGYEVTTRTGSVDALEKFKIDPYAFDLVLTDMSMPNMTGEKLAREMIAIRPDIPVILCTGFSERIDEQKAQASGVKGFLMKPIVNRDIAETVRKVLDNTGNTSQ